MPLLPEIERAARPRSAAGNDFATGIALGVAIFPWLVVGVVFWLAS